MKSGKSNPSAAENQLAGRGVALVSVSVGSAGVMSKRAKNAACA
jgi:hypothetical protein